MKLKTPLFLILIVGSIVAAIFLVWPEFQKIAPQRAEIVAKENLVASIREKNSNIARLTQSLADQQNASQRDFVWNYVPLGKKEELIFNSINGIANAEGVKVALSNLSLQSAKEETVTTAAEVPPVASQYPLADPVSGGMIVQPASLLPAVKILKADIAVVGSYEAQKAFIAKLYSLDMLKRIVSFKLASASTEGGSSGSVINGTVVAEFSFIPEAKIGKDYNSPIFSQSRFDFAPVEKLKALLSQKAAGVAVGESGRSNPFMP